MEAAMKLITLTVGFAAGYVLGTRAGRERYEQIAAMAHKMSDHPTVAQAHEKAKDLFGSGDDAATMEEPDKSSPSSSEPFTATPTITGDPLAQR
jgi:hypothetical protein